MSNNRLVDIHAHILPPHYLDAMASRGVNDVDGFPLPSWSVENAVAAMDANGIGTAVLSVSSPGTIFTDGEHAAAVARKINLTFAEMFVSHPGRFGAFALLPWNEADKAVVELRYALDTLGLDGVGLYTNVRGRYLGDPYFDPVFAELDQRGATVFVHPVRPPNFDAVSLELAAPVIEFPFDTTRSICNLIGSGALRRYPNIKFIFLHGGGVLPFLALRVSSLLPIFRKLTPELTADEIMEQIRSLYFDLANASHPFALDAVTRLMPKDHLLYGSDFPFLPAATIAVAKRSLEEHGCFSPEELQGVYHANAMRLLPSLAARSAAPSKGKSS